MYDFVRQMSNVNTFASPHVITYNIMVRLNSGVNLLESDTSYRLTKIILENTNMYKEPYATQLGKAYRVQPLRDELLKAYVTGDITTKGTIGSMGSVPYIDTVPEGINLFNHPIVISTRDGEAVVVDKRPFMNSMYNITNPKEIMILDVTALLMADWIHGITNGIMTDGKFSGTVFVSVISAKITANYDLNAVDQEYIKAVLAMYYGGLMVEEEYTADSRLRAMLRYAKTQVVIAERIAKEGADVSSLEALCTAIKTTTQNIKLSNFNALALLTLVNTVIFGYNSKERIAIALEYPPLWTALVFVALTDKSFRSTYVSRVATKLSSRGGGDEFVAFITTKLKEISQPEQMF